MPYVEITRNVWDMYKGCNFKQIANHYYIYNKDTLNYIHKRKYSVYPDKYYSIIKFNEQININSFDKNIICTHTSKEIVNKIINKFDIENINDIISIEDIKELKPSPEIYIKAIEKHYNDGDEIEIYEDTRIGLLSALNIKEIYNNISIKIFIVDKYTINEEV